MTPSTIDLAWLRQPRDPHAVLTLPAELGPVLADAVEIADRFAGNDIDEFGRMVKPGWYDAGPQAGHDLHEIAALTLAVRYLEARGLLERHPVRRELVWVVEK